MHPHSHQPLGPEPTPAAEPPLAFVGIIPAIAGLVISTFSLSAPRAGSIAWAPFGWAASVIELVRLLAGTGVSTSEKTIRFSVMRRVLVATVAVFLVTFTTAAMSGVWYAYRADPRPLARADITPLAWLLALTVIAFVAAVRMARKSVVLRR